MSNTETPKELLALWSHRQRFNQKAHYYMSESLGGRAFWFGVVSACVSGLVALLLIVKARLGLPDYVVHIAAGLSVVSSVLGTVITSARWSDKASQHHAAGAAYGAVLRRIQQTQALGPESEDEFIESVTAIRKEIDSIPTKAPGIPKKVWKKLPKELTPDSDNTQQGA